MTATDNSAAPITITQSHAVTATDNCSGATLSCSPPSGSVFLKGTNTVTCNATDDVGNAATKSFKVIVNDTEAPTIAGIVPSADTLWPPSRKLVPVTLAVNATDNCDTPTCEIIDVSSSEPVVGGEDTTSPDWVVTGPLSVSLRAERLSTSPGRVYTITVRCTDSSGNLATKKVTVTVPRDLSKQSHGEL